MSTSAVTRSSRWRFAVADPETHLALALQYQEEFDRLGDPTNGWLLTSVERERRLHVGVVAENHALLAVAGFLSQQHICAHGTRGWCPYCHISLKEGQFPT